MQAAYVKGKAQTDIFSIAECDKHIPLFHLDDFRGEKYLNSINCSEDEVRYFAQSAPEKIPNKEKCIRHPKNKTFTPSNKRD